MDEIKDASWKEAPKGQAGQGSDGAGAPDITPYLNAPFEVRMLEKGGRFVLYIPELGLTASGKDLAAAHAELKQARERRLKEFAAEGVLDWLPKPGKREDNAAGLGAGPGVLVKLKPFLIKAAVITLMFLGAVNVIGQGVRDTGYKLEKQLEGLSNWTPEKVEWHRERAQKIAEKLGPTMREILVMFREPVAAGTGAESVPAAPSAVPSAVLGVGEAAKPAAAPAASAKP